ncbi:cell division protein FtsQ [Peptococcaceae bacterium CEB3]|nr:cell division protein FtsQ [Peptococcaceae bacterium CEB3]
MPAKRTNTFFLYVSVLVVMLAVGLVVAVRSGVFTIRHISVTGLQQIPESDIQRLAEGALGQNLFLFDREGLTQKIMLHPLVRSVEFRRKFPDTLEVQVTERKPAALLVVPNGVLEVDSQGVFLRRLEGWPKVDYPVLTGVTVPDTAGPGQRLTDPGLAAELKVLDQAPTAMLPMLSEVQVNVARQVTLFLTSGVEVRLGQADEWKDKLAVLFNLLQDKDYQSIQQGVAYIDFTAATPVIGR